MSRTARRSLAVLTALAMLVGSADAAMADNATADADVTQTGQNYRITDCTVKQVIPSAVIVRWDGNKHLNPTSSISFSATTPVGSGITFIQPTPFALSGWQEEGKETPADALVPATLTVPAGIAPGNYQVDVTVNGTLTNNEAFRDTDNFNVKVDDPCVPVTPVIPVIPVTVDTTAPVITYAVTGTLGGNDWYTSDTTLDWTVTDPESGVSTSGCDDVTVSSNTQGITYLCTATSAGGTSSRSVTIKVDKTAPTVSLALTGLEGTNDWFTGPVTATWTTGDPTSGASLCAPQVVSGDTGGTTVSCTSTNGAGLSTIETGSVRIDGTPPVIVAEVDGIKGANGWYISDVDVSWDVSDATSRLASSSCLSNSVTADTTGATFSCTAADNAGNLASSPVTVKRDATVPVVTFTGTGVYDIDQTVNLACTVADNLSGVASTNCPTVGVSGNAWQLLAGGSATGTATDFAGNGGSATGTYSVVATVNGSCRLISRFVTNAGVANSLCVKLRNSAAAKQRGSLTAAANLLGAYDKEVTAQAGKHIPTQYVSIVRLLATFV